MKKIIFAALFLLAFTGVGFSQATQPKKAADPKAATASTTTTHTKKDGTADMRYKENKAAKATPPTTHTKKDGTADKRYKENKPKTN